MKFNEMDKKRADVLWKILQDNEGHYIAQEYICSIHPVYFKWVNNTSGGTDGCREIWNTIQYINYSPEYDGVVLIKNRQYKIATDDEAEKFYKTIRKNGIKKLVRAKYINEKLANKNQLSLFDYSEERVEEAINLAVNYLENAAKTT